MKLKYTLAALTLLSSPGVECHKLTQYFKQQQAQQGIFSKMIELATTEDKAEMERKEAVERKKRQLEEAEIEHEKLVKEEEEEEEKERQLKEEQLENERQH